MIRIKNTTITTIVSLAIILILLLVPTGYEGAVQFKDAVKCKVKVLTVDNSRIIDTGLIRSGQQVCEIKFLSGKFKGQTAEGWNMLGGSLAQDKLFVEGDKVQAVVHWEQIDEENYTINSVNLIDYYRLTGELILSLAFVIFMLIFARGTGLRAIFSFIITVLSIWKILIPLYLKGFDPIFTALIVVLLITVVILGLVYGFDKRLLSSVSGAFLGILLAAVLSIIFTKVFHLHGAIMSHSESLLYSGYENLSLTRIFMASVFIGASGSVMDLSVDVTSAVNEVVKNCPNISTKDAIKSGMTVARAAMSTMTTTLLLAYSGSCIALIMTFMAQGTPIYNILNNNQVAAEIINTIAGSFGLASTAPFTAFLAGVILTKRNQNSKSLRNVD